MALIVTVIGLLLGPRKSPMSRELKIIDQETVSAPSGVTNKNSAATVSEVANDGLPFRDPGPTDSHTGPVHPHPITSERIRIQRENQLIGAMSDAMDVRDGEQLRKSLNKYREQYPEDPNQLQEGYQIIADCLEQLGAASAAVGQHYYEKERGSILRRFVGRYCLEL